MEMSILGSEALLKKALEGVPKWLLPHGITGGDTKVIWNPDNESEVENARRTFNDLKKKGFAAFKNNGDKGEQIFDFDPHAKLIMVPQMRGGAECRPAITTIKRN